MRLDLPAKLRGAAREAVAQRQLIDMLGPEAEMLQMRPFTLGGAGDGWGRVLVADRAQLAAWRGMAGRHCVALLPDYLALPIAEGLWTVAGEGGHVRARFGPEDGTTTTESVLCLQAARYLSEDVRPDRVLRFGPPLPAFEAQMAEAGITVVTDPKEAGTPPPRTFALGELALDLRADPQAARTRMVRQIRAWRWPVLTGALAAGLWAAAQLTVIRATEAEIAALTAETLQTTRQTFVPNGPILDIRVQIARVLNDAREALRAESNDVSPLSLFARAAPVISSAQAAPQSVAWEAGGGLRLVLRLDDFAAADALVDALAALDLRVEMQDARLSEDNDRVMVDIELMMPENGG